MLSDKDERMTQLNAASVPAPVGCTMRCQIGCKFMARFAKNRASLNFLTGMVIGFLLCCQFQQIAVQTKNGAFCASREKRHSKVEDKFTIVNQELNISNASSERKLLFVGVMTAQKYLESRALTIYKTWAQTVPGNLLFFSSSSSRSEHLPVINLPTVDDSYPPQKKSFLMLKYIIDHFIDDFEWFFRADDDVYVDTARLEEFLRSINNSKPYFIGQPGVGNKEEFGQLNLEATDNFCMGGPGVIMSRPTLMALAPHIQYCLKHLYSTHEDVEVGRCVRKFVGISCTWSYEMTSIFYHNFSGEISIDNSLNSHLLMNAITLHPFKVPSKMYKFHSFHLQRKHRKIRRKISTLHRVMNEIESLSSLENVVIYKNSSLLQGSHSVIPHQDQCLNREDILTWNFIDRYLHSDSNVNPKRRIEGHIRSAIDVNIAEIVSSINKQSKQKGRIIEFKNLYYGYMKIDPLKGAHYILDMFLMYKKYKGKKMSIPVRRHTYAIQNYAKTEIKEVNLTSNRQTTVNLVVPLSGRLEPFKRFMNNFLEIYSKDPDVSLCIVLFPDASESQNELRETKRIINSLMEAGIPLKFAQLGGHFARAAGLQRGSYLFKNNDLLFFVDIDMHLKPEALELVRLNTVEGEQIYYPIVMSQYNPRFATRNLKENISIDNVSGYWRQYGFGIVSLYNSDLQKAGGLNIAIQGWGQEDVDLFVKIVHSNLNVIRSPDNNLVHIYHEIKCNPSLLTAMQYEMCLGTKFASLGSIDDLYDYATRLIR